MSYYRHKQQQGRRKQWLGVLLLALVAVAVAALFGVKLLLEQRRPTLDPDTLCPVDGATGYLAIVFDKTDAYNPIQQRFLQRYFTAVQQQIAVGTRVSLFVVDGREQPGLAPELSLCNPGDGRQANALYENPALLQKRWRERFAQPLEQAIGNSITAARADRSPIFETLQAVALSAFPPLAASTVPTSPRRVILVSDMIQHTPQWSFYRGQNKLSALRASPYYQQVRTDLGGAEVQILYVRRERSEQLQTQRYALFWADYIASIGGRVTVVEHIDG